MSTPLPRITFVDALRGWAILGVMLVHTSQTVDGLDSLRGCFSHGARGVQLFYLVSSFTLCWITHYVHTDERSWLPYFARRYCRIAPMYYVAVLLCLAVYAFGTEEGLWRVIFESHIAWSGGRDTVTAANVIANLTFVHGANPYWIAGLVPGGWSIADEFTFYAVFPFLAAYASNMRRACMLTGAALATAAGLHLILADFQPISDAALWRGYLFFWFPSQLPFFCLGFVLFQFYRRLPLNDSRGQSSLGIILIMISLGMLFFLFIGGRVWLLPIHWAFGFAFLLLSAGLACRPAVLPVNKFTAKLGEISFSCYILHWFVLDLVIAFRDSICSEILREPVITFAVTYITVVLCTAALSWITWKWIEIPGIRFGKMLAGRVGPRRQCR